METVKLKNQLLNSINALRVLLISGLTYHYGFQILFHFLLLGISLTSCKVSYALGNSISEYFTPVSFFLSFFPFFRMYIQHCY